MGDDVRVLNFGLSSRNGTAEFTFFEGFSLLSGYYTDAATEREVVKNYVRNQKLQGLEGAAEFETHADELLEQRFTERTFTTELRTLSSVMETEGIEKIDLLKINVEKSELDVLEGIAECDWPKIAQLVVEIDVPEHLKTIVTMLESRGYDVLVEQDRLLNDTPLCYAYAIRPSAERRLIRVQADGTHLREVPPIADDAPTPTELQEYLKRRLPGYMVPDHVVLIDEFPLTPNGKLDRQRLVVRSTRDVRRRRKLSSRRALRWKNCWRRRGRASCTVERVGIHDNFFELGGHSLLAMRVAARLRTEFGLDLPVRALFDSPTVAQLSIVLLGELANQGSN